jgi:hypothetical protein
MSDINSAYASLKDDVQKFTGEIDRHPHFMKYSKGTQILYSNLHFKPKFMFIGINPGGGYAKYNNGKLVQEFDVQNQLEYSYLKFKYPLALNTRKLFELAGCSRYLKTSVKTNCFFFATTNENQLYQMLSHVKHLGVYKKSEEWTARLIQIVEPEIIICEGASAFERVVNMKNGVADWQDGVGYAFVGNQHIIGYKRTYSHIRDIGSVAEKIKDVLNMLP